MKAIGIVALAAFTIFITWRAKILETSLLSRNVVSLSNKRAPEFALLSLDGRKVSLADYRGKKKLVVTFWASWCGPCRLELSVLRSFYQRNHKASDNFEILAISIDDDPNAATTFASQARINFPVLFDSTHRTADAYDVSAIPATFVIDETGKVVHGRIGFESIMEFQLMHELGLDKREPNGNSKEDGAPPGG